MNNLKVAREQRGWSQTRAIAAIRSTAHAAGIEVPSTTSMKTQLSRWENGHRAPDAFYRKILSTVYGLTVQQLGLTDDTDLLAGALSMGRTWKDVVDNASNLWKEDMNRRSLLQASAFSAAAFAGPTLGALVCSPTDPPTQLQGDRLVRHSDVAAVREMTKSFAGLDNAHGGGQIRSAAVGYLANEVSPLLRHCRFDASVGRALFVSAAELTQLVGWMSHDVGAHGAGQRYLIQALGLAKAANDGALTGEILAAMSHQATYLGDGAQAVDLARAAGQIAQKQGVAALVAESHVMEAHGYAAQGHPSKCSKSLHAAELALDQADRAEDPHWIGYFDEAYLSAKFGHCFRILGDHANAIRFAERSLNMNSARYARGHAFNLSLLAHSHAQAHNVEQACDIGQQAAAATARLRSNRALQYLRDVSNALPDRHRGTSVVNTFHNAVDTLTAAV